MLSLHVPQNGMMPWTPPRVKNQPTLEVWNRYLTPDQGHEDEEEVPLEYIDPVNLLSSRVPKGMRHVGDNVVLYYQMPAKGDRYACTAFLNLHV